MVTTVLRDEDDATRRQQKLERINEVLLDRLSRIESRRGSAWAVFQAAAALEKEVAARNRDLEKALQNLSDRNQELALARAAAEQANRSKTRFLRAASHDLIQPIAAAKLYLETLGDTPLSPQQRGLLTRLGSAFASVEELMQSVMEIARLDSSRIRFNLQPVAMGEMFGRLADEFGPIAAAKGLQLKVATSSATVESDMVYLRRIAQNLLSNAIKYTPAGKVLLGVRHDGDRIWMEVHDTGVGIAEADRSRIFDEFQRLPNDGVSGMGLGLSIVRRACGRLGYPIEMKSRPGRGTMFRIGLPLADEREIFETASADAAPVPEGLGGLTVMLIEDDAGLRHAYEHLLADSFGMRVASFGSSADALADPAPAPDVIIADYNLGYGDTGLLAIAGLRNKFGVVPGVIVTARLDDATVEACADLGIPAHAKPISVTQLRAALENAVREQR
ncbi:hybrid sensor histidine kinase/response regulator [Paracoccus sp. S1E-3]|nr:hybrid sensor histidine kinase/response regulator [Paracoccus sp. S1E-3]